MGVVRCVASHLLMHERERVRWQAETDREDEGCRNIKMKTKITKKEEEGS